MLGRLVSGIGCVLAVAALLSCGSSEEESPGGAGPSASAGAPSQGGAGGTQSAGGSPSAGGSAGESSGGTTTGSGGVEDPGGGSGGSPPITTGDPCVEASGTDPIAGSVDLGLASNPEIAGIPGGTADERAIFDQLNAEREAAGLAPLIWSDKVANVARSHAADMSQLGYFGHGSSTREYHTDTGTNRENWLPFPRLDYVYPDDFRRAGENIARSNDPVNRVIDMWMGSDGHRAAILDEYGWDATHGAMGIYDGLVVFNPAQCAEP